MPYSFEMTPEWIAMIHKVGKDGRTLTLEQPSVEDAIRTQRMFHDMKAEVLAMDPAVGLEETKQSLRNIQTRRQGRILVLRPTSSFRAAMATRKVEEVG